MMRVLTRMVRGRRKHPNWSGIAKEIERTIDEVTKMRPTMVVPSHCTGFKAIRQFANRMPDEFVLGVVGTTYLF